MTLSTMLFPAPKNKRAEGLALLRSVKSTGSLVLADYTCRSKSVYIHWPGIVAICFALSPSPSRCFCLKRKEI